MRGLALAWRGALSRCPAHLGVALVWTASLWIAFNPGAAHVPAIPLFASAAVLAFLSRSKARLVAAAVSFLTFWSLAAWLLRDPSAAAPFRPGALAAWLFLGLHLFLAWTPAQLGRAARVLAGPVAGPVRAALLGLALTALAKAVPYVLADAVTARRALRRVPRLGARRRTALWGRAAVRLAMKRTAGLGRSLAKRQDDLG